MISMGHNWINIPPLNGIVMGGDFLKKNLTLSRIEWSTKSLFYWKKCVAR